MEGTVQAQLRVIHRVVEVLSAADVPVWLFGGWGLDARIGRITRDHGDVEFWVRRSDDPRSKTALVDAGSVALATQPPEEACEFVWDGVAFSTAYFDRRADGTFTLQGRWSDWTFPPDSFGENPGLLDGIPVPAMSVAGMLAMKEQFPTLRNGGPWRDKDIGDIAVLRGTSFRAGLVSLDHSRCGVGGACCSELRDVGRLSTPSYRPMAIGAARSARCTTLIPTRGSGLLFESGAGPDFGLRDRPFLIGPPCCRPATGERPVAETQQARTAGRSAMADRRWSSSTGSSVTMVR